MDRTALDVIEGVAAVLRSGERAALATVVGTSGSTPRREGTRLLLRSDGTRVGTIGGGRIEQVVLEALAECLDDGDMRTRRWHLTRDLGMCCGGAMEVRVEPIDGGPRLWLFGAGHVGQATAELAHKAGFHVEAVDEREEWLERLPLPPERQHATSAERALRTARLSTADFALIATHDPRLDEQALLAALRRPHRYVGLVASRCKALRLAARVLAREPDLCLDQTFAPVGLDVGGESPWELAVAIVAELQAVRHGRPAVHKRLDLAAEQPRDIGRETRPGVELHD